MKSFSTFLCSIGVIVVSAQMPVHASSGMSLLDAANMKIARMGHYTALLPDGRAVLFGGHGTSFVSLATSEIYSPQADSFISYAMNGTRDAPALARLANGKYLLAGGAADLGVAPGSRTAEIFDPADNSFTAVAGQLTYGRMTSCAATLSNGNVLIVGGWYNANSPTYPELFDSSSQTFSLTKALTTPRAWPLVVPTSDGKALVFGGIGSYGGAIHEQVELFNPSDSSFSVVGNNLFGLSDTGWSGGSLVSYDRALDQQKMKNGKYLFFATKSGHYALFTVDPSTKEFTRITTSPVDFIDTTLSILPPLVDTLHNRAYILAEKWETSLVRLCCYVVNLDDWSVNIPDGLDSLPDSYFLSGIGLHVMKDGRILMSGGHSQTGYNTNFSPINKAKWIIPDTTSQLTPLKHNGKKENSAFVRSRLVTVGHRTLFIDFRATETVIVDLYDAAGKNAARIYKGAVAAGTKLSIPLKTLQRSPGVYFCSIQGGAGCKTFKVALW